MKTLNLVQGSTEWHKHRASSYNASEAPAMKGASKYMTRDQLIHQQKTGETKAIDHFLQELFDKGHAAEAAIRPHIEKIVGEDLYPVTGVEYIDGVPLSASFDGLTLLEDIVFEHKLWNERLAANMKAGVIEAHYNYQIQQQLMISNADKAIFVTSDGTPDKMEYIWVYPNKEIFEELLHGWKRFGDDLAAYKPKVEAVKPEAEAIMELPAVNIQITGGVKDTNLAVYKESAESFIASINTDLKTDEDFANAEKTVIFCEAAEKKLDAVKEQAISQTADIDELFKTLDFLKQQMRAKRLDLNKSVTTKKAEIKKQIIDNAFDEFLEYEKSTNKMLGDSYLNTDPSFHSALKGKKTVASLQSAANDEVARLKIEIDKQAKLIKTNLNSIPAEYDFLFKDLRLIVNKAEDDFVLLAKTRIQEYKDAEAAKAEALRVENERLKAEAEKETPATESEGGGINGVSDLSEINPIETPATNQRNKEYELHLTEEIKQSLINNGIGKQTAQKVAKLIVAGEVDHVSI